MGKHLKIIFIFLTLCLIGATEAQAAPTEYTEEQTETQYDWGLYAGGNTRAGQRLAISNRKVAKLGFWLSKVNSPTGPVTLTIRKVSDDSLISSKVWGDAADLPTERTYKEVEFDDPKTINEGVRILTEFSGGSTNDQVRVAIKLSDVKPNEEFTYFETPDWTDSEGYDAAYRYAYEMIEQQTEHNQDVSIKGTNAPMWGQKLTIPNRKVTKLAFIIFKVGNPTGDVSFRIYRVSNDELICSKVWGDASELPTEATWEEVTFDNPQIINEEVRIVKHHIGGASDNYVATRCQTTDVKNNEYITHGNVGSWYDNLTDWDDAYRYTYEYIEEQTQYDSDLFRLSGTEWWRRGQRLTIPNRIVTKLGFWLSKLGSPTGDINLTTRKLDNTVICSKYLMDAADLTGDATYYEVEFDDPQIVNEEVRILAEYSGGDGNNDVPIWTIMSDVKANEMQTQYNGTWSEGSGRDTAYRYKYTLPGISSPTVTTAPATAVGTTTATLNGEITDDGGEACEYRFEYDTGSGEPYASSTDWTGSVTTSQSFNEDISGLLKGTLYYFRAQAKNSAGTSSASELTFLTKPDAPTNVQATDGTHTDKVVVSWNAVTGTTGYKIYNSLSGDWIDIGDVTSWEHATSSAPTITPGSTLASDGTSTDYINLSLSETSANNGSEVTYRVKAYNNTGEGAESETDTGYRGIGSLTYQWQRSAGDSDTDHSNISGATSSTYQDTEAPTYIVNAPTDVSVSAQSTSILRIAFSGASITEGEGRYYKCILNADGASQQTSSADRGYRDDSIAEANGYEVFSDTEAEGSYSTSEEATSTSPFDDTDLSPNARKYYKIRVKSTAGTWSNLSTVYDGQYTLANPPSNLLLTTDSPNQIVISWSANNNPSGTEYFCENITQGTNSSWITGTNWVSSNLSPGTEYIFRVKARNGDEVSTVWTSEESLSTLSAGGAAPVLPPASITGQGNISQNLGGEISQTFNSGKIAKVVFPPFSIEGTVVTKIEPRVKAEVIKNNPLPQNTQMIGDLVADFKALSGIKEIESFEKKVTVTFTYTDKQITEAKIDEKTLKIYWWDESIQTWKPLKSNINTLTNTITALTSHFTLFAVMGELVVEEEEVVEKPIEGMTIEEIKAKIREIQQKIIELLTQLIQIIQEEIIQLQAPLP